MDPKTVVGNIGATRNKSLKRKTVSWKVTFLLTKKILEKRLKRM